MKKGSILILVGVSLFIMGMVLFTRDATLGAWIHIIGAFICMVFGFCYAFCSRTSKNNSSNPKEQELSAQYSNALNKLIETIQMINSSYMLNLPPSTMNKIASSSNPLLEMSKYVTAGYPSVPNFCFYMATKCEEIIFELDIPEEKSAELYSYCLESLSATSEGFSEKDIIDITKSYAENLPAELSFLSDKVNYETSALGLIANYAISKADGVLIKKINEHRKKRGYIQ